VYSGRRIKNKLCGELIWLCNHLKKNIQCCGAETFCFRSGSGSDFQKVPAPAPTLALYLPFFITDFILKSGFVMFF
jgi:hypothetical protein